MEQIIVSGSTNHYVSIAPEHRSTYNDLKRLAGAGNYWALLAVHEINSLLSSNVFKPNVYTHVEAGTNGYKIYKLVLPGCTVYAHKQGSGFFIYRIEADSSFHKLQEGLKKPGLHSVVRSEQDRWQSSFVANGKVNLEAGRLVAVSGQHATIKEAIENSVDAMTSSSVNIDDLTLRGFDLHFTPPVNRTEVEESNRQIAANPETSKALHESALLLAMSMTGAKNIKMVRWVTEGAGSGVMTQAMQILKDKNISFRDTKHKVFFSGISTNLVKAEQLARDLELDIRRYNYSRNHLVPGQLFGAGLFSGYAATWKRFRQDKKHTLLKMSADAFNETSKLAKPVTIGLGVAVGLGVPVMSVALPAALTFALAVGPKAVSKGATLVEAWLPKLYKNIKGKL